MNKKLSGQALIEYAFLLVLVVLAVIAVLNMVSPAVGSTFHNAVNDTVNSDIQGIGLRVTQTVYAATHGVGSTSTFTPVPPTATFTSTPSNTPAPATATFTSTPTKTNTPIPATATFTYTPSKTNTPVPPTNTATATKTLTPSFTNTATATATNTFTPIPPTATFTATATATPSGPWTFCSNENGTCSFYVGTTIVRYGASGSYVYKTITNSTPCTNAVFGDPISGTAKQCYYQGTPPINSIVSVTAVRNTTGTNTNKNKVVITIDLASTTVTSLVTINDSQYGLVINNLSCLNSCTYTMNLTSSHQLAGTVTISGADFGTQTMQASYLQRQ